MAEHDDFDERASTWDDDPKKVARAHRVAALIVEHVALRGDERLLEYGAGTGVLSETLRPHVGSITVADRSAGMLDVLRQKASGGALDGATVLAVDLAADPPPRQRFDLIASVMVLHHVGDVERLFAAFHELLDPGGLLCLCDLDAEDGSFHGADFEGHPGFERTELARMLVEAGFELVETIDAGTVHKQDRDYGLFLAMARRR